MSEKKLKHLEFIQGVISRMAGNLFYLRGWVITLIAGILVLLTQVAVGKLPVIFLTMIILIFWIYDGYFLSLERMHRDLYGKVRNLEEEKIDFSMSVNEFRKFKKNSIIFCIFSKTLLFFYAPLLISALYVIFYIK
jgi:hypothetical protein